MKLLRIARFLLLSFVFIAVACSSPDEEQFIDTELCVTAVHHAQIVPRLQFYVMLDTEVFPGFDHLEEYDLTASADQFGRACFEDLPIGGHFVAVQGFDEEWNDTVVGNAFIRLEPHRAMLDTLVNVNE